jgi:hypothetical protein
MFLAARREVQAMKLDQPATRPLPESYGRSNQREPSLREIHGLVVGMTECRTDARHSIPTDKALDWLLGKSVFTSVQSTGMVDALLKHIPFPALERLHRTGRTYHDGFQIWRRSTHNDIHITVRKGNKTGSISNAWSVCGDMPPDKIRETMERAFATFRKYDLPCGDMRSAGHIADQIMNKFSRYDGKQWWTKRPDDLVQHMFLQSFRGARIESTTFGSVGDVSDYDISSAYGWAMAQLPNTRNVYWLYRPDLALAESACYGAILCDVSVNPSLHRGPIAYRVGESRLFYPVGDIKGCWLNLPEIQLLLEYPEIGVITKVHEGRWGIPQFEDNYRPFDPMVNALYQMRQNEPWLGSRPKEIMVSCWGKTPSVFEGVANRHWNPVVSSAITSMIRARNYRESLESGEVIGEWTDGFAVQGWVPQLAGGGLGHMRLEGAGNLLIAADNVKESHWKHTETGTGLSVAELLRESKDKTDMRWQARYLVGLDQVITGELDPSLIGTERVDEYRFPLGSHIRLALGPMRGGDLLEGQVETAPPKQSQISMMMDDWIERAVKIA